jgi:DNA-binding response OmpR family regulator
MSEKRILIVDDEPVMVETLRFALEREGYVCREAKDGEEAIATIRADPPDLILLDVMMPGLNGYQVCRFVKETAGLRHIPVILLTARAQERDRAMGTRSGADDYVTKPFAMETLLALVRRRLGRTPAAAS